MEESTTVKRGIIINGETRKGRLSVFQCTIWPQMETILKMSESPEAALRATTVPAGIAWLSGTAATKQLAKKFCLQYRLRAPGAGRPTKTKDDKVKKVTFCLRADLHPELKAIVKRFKKEKAAKK